VTLAIGPNGQGERNREQQRESGDEHRPVPARLVRCMAKRAYTMDERNECEE